MNVRIELSRSKSFFCLIPDLDKAQAKKIEVSIFTRQMAVEGSYCGRTKSNLAVDVQDIIILNKF